MVAQTIAEAHNEIDKARHARGIGYGTHFGGCKFFLYRSHLDCNCAEIHDARQKKADHVERLEAVKDAASHYFQHWLRDESEDRDVCHSDEQHEAARRLRDALAACGLERI